MINTAATILIVDDDFTNLKVLGKLLKENAFNVEAAPSGARALEILDEITPDLILLDVMMPEMDGFATCSRIRQRKELNSVPIIFLSALDQADKMVKGIQCGAIDYMLKPYNSKLLISKIGLHLDLKFKTQALEELTQTLEQKVEERTKELELANEELMKLDEIKTEFLHIISHEIRTPLNGIIGFTALLKMEKKKENIASFIDILERSIRRLERFSLNALLYTQLKAKKTIPLKRLCNLVNLIDSAILRLDNCMSRKDINFNIDIANDMEISADNELIIECFQNIIDNAIKYSDNQSQITIKAKKADDGVLVQIIDSGKGFSSKAMANLFKPFSPGEDFVNENEGLELALCKLIMDRHDGDIHVENLAKGASVNLLFKP